METVLDPTLAPPQSERRLKMTYEEFLDWSDEDTHAEWVDGEVIVFMPPIPHHQDVTGFIALLLRLFVELMGLGKVYASPMEMKVRPEGAGREPDILFVSQENLARVAGVRLEGPADLVIEIVSDESVSRDRTDKFYEYQAAGVREYWVIDPRPGKQREDIWLLDESGLYQPIPLEGGILRSHVVPGFWLRSAWLRQEELPQAFEVFAEIVGLPQEVREEMRRLATR